MAYPGHGYAHGNQALPSADPGREGVTGTYVTGKGGRAPWRKSVPDADARAAVWALCEKLSGLTVNRAAI
ncbi:hypothetical protein GCM10023191_037340 [Actinoallomurus oryzae]|uniref:Uncharacterized protein n=1 Tax=Actinoallomurus oryzae TaxID=502180 RepID=A0ABP8Q2D6_9ACTN